MAVTASICLLKYRINPVRANPQSDQLLTTSVQGYPWLGAFIFRLAISPINEVALIDMRYTSSSSG